MRGKEWGGGGAINKPAMLAAGLQFTITNFAIFKNVAWLKPCGQCSISRQAYLNKDASTPRVATEVDDSLFFRPRWEVIYPNNADSESVA